MLRIYRYYRKLSAPERGIVISLMVLGLSLGLKTASEYPSMPLYLYVIGTVGVLVCVFWSIGESIVSGIQELRRRKK